MEAHERATMALTESDFHQRVDAVLARVEGAMDDVECDINAELNGGILTLDFENGTKVIVNRQTPDRKSTRLNSSHPRLSRMPSSA